MHILVTGGTGFIGDALLPELLAAGHRLSILTRQIISVEDRGDQSFVNSPGELTEAVDAVINLAGASLAGKRWNTAYKNEIIASRVSFTESLGESLAAKGGMPRVWLNASAIGYYGPQDHTRLDESASQGMGFAANLCADWEQMARRICGDNTRLCLLRLGVVLDQGGGAFAQMAAPFRFGIANWLGGGDQYLSWIHRRDVVAAIHFLLQDESASGAFNLTAPEPVTSKEFCAAMKKVYPSLPAMPMPAPVMRLMVGEMADELLLSGQRVVPQRLKDSGFTFMFPSIDKALGEIRKR